MLCVFCDGELNPGGEEHVFLSAIGGRLMTARAICQGCNNAFASDETGKIDDALAEGFDLIRNGLKIWSGRDDPPPVIKKAGCMEDGAEFDLAAGFTPVMRAGRIPKQLDVGDEISLIAKDEADVARMQDILKKRGLTFGSLQATKVEQKVPIIKRSLSFNGDKVFRSIAKSAITAFVVLHGNDQARRIISPELRAAVRYGTHDINDFCGWDFTNPWPTVSETKPHKISPDAVISGFEHSVIICEVQNSLIAYVTLFGHFRFSVHLGSASGLQSKGMAINPRPAKAARFIVAVVAPSSYQPKNKNSFRVENALIQTNVGRAFNTALTTWQSESHDENDQKWADALAQSIADAGEEARSAAMTAFAERKAAVEFGSGWKTDLKIVSVDEDGDE